VHRDLLAAIACPACHRDLTVAEEHGDAKAIARGHLRCFACAAQYPIEDYVGRLGDSEALHQAADWLSEDVLTDELIRRNAANENERYQANPHFASWLGAIAETTGLILDIATGPGGSMFGALMPRLGPGSRVVATDAAAPTVDKLHRYWSDQPQSAMMDFLVCDANHLPFHAASVDAITSVGGFENVRLDRRLHQPARGEAYVEAARVLKPSGLIFDSTTVYGVDSETAAAFIERGDPFASRETLQELWASLGLVVQSFDVTFHGRGKVHPLDGLPLSDEDEWEAVQWVLEKQ
jgi:uncharacterized protein YbaR (Trm112 family)